MIRVLTQADKQIVMKYLEGHEIETSFLYANIIEFGIDNEKDKRRCADYYGFFKGNALKGILPFYNLGSCIPHYEEEDALEPFSELMKERNFEFLLGMNKIIKPLYENIKEYKKVQESDESSYFINKNFKPFIVEGVKFIEVDRFPKEDIVNFIVDSRVKGFNHQVTKEDIQKMLQQRGQEEEFIIAEKRGKMIAQANIQTYTPQINQIGGVYTIEEERGKGYCKAVTSEISRRIIERGKTPTLCVKKSNVPAVKAYRALGFEHYDDYLIIKLK